MTLEQAIRLALATTGTLDQHTTAWEPAVTIALSELAAAEPCTEPCN